MAYHEAFWLADATIGPVVVLAQTVLVGRFTLWRGQLVADLPRAERETDDEIGPISAYLWANPVVGQGNLDAAMLDLARQFDRRRLRRIVRRARRLARAAYLTVALSLATVGLAVYSLAWDRDVISVTVAADLIVASLAALLGETIGEVRLRLRVQGSDLAVAAVAVQTD